MLEGWELMFGGMKPACGSLVLFLAEMGANLGHEWDGIAGSQDVHRWDLRLRGRPVIIETETPPSGDVRGAVRIRGESGGGRYCPGVRGRCLDASTSVPIGV